MGNEKNYERGETRITRESEQWLLKKGDGKNKKMIKGKSQMSFPTKKKNKR